LHGNNFKESKFGYNRTETWATLHKDPSTFRW